MKLIINKIANHCTRFISCICIVWLIFCQINAQSLLTENFNYAQSTLLRSFTWTPFAETDIRNLTVHEDNTNDAVKLSVNPSLSSEPFESDIADSSRIALIQDLEANIPILEVDDLNVGSIGESMTSAIYDFGDVPVSYENSKDGVFLPAGHIPLAGFSLGSIVPDVEEIPYSVANGEDNNDSNGDGLDEDAVEVSLHQIRKSVPYSLSLPVNNPATTTKYLYGWIDFNNDGKFQAEEFTNTAFSVVGSSTQTLNWTATQTATIASAATKLYMRLRVSDRALSDFTNAAGGGAIIDERSIGNGAVSANNPADFGTAANGEVEDYQIEVLTTYDYGDLPSSFENDKDGNLIPALHAPLTGFTIGSLIDLEQAPASVNSQNENNTAGDNAVELADEDGITSWPSVSRGVAYTLTVPVNIPNSLAGTKYLYAWLDLNGDGRFQSEEVTSAATNAIAPANLTLTWTAAQTATLVRGTTKVYLRLRLSNLILTDFTTAASGGSLLDERSVGNGATTTANAANNPNIAFGEVEDYQMPVDLYDFGDVPVSYENSKDGVFLPAGHIPLAGFSLGSIVPDVEEIPYSVANGEDNNDSNGDGLDEDAVEVSLHQIRKAVPYSLSLPVNNPATSTKYLYGWIDFNNDGKFQAEEFANTAFSVVGSSTQTLNWTATQTATIASPATKLYMRLRISDRALSDFTNAAGGGAIIDERSIGNGAVSANNPADFGTAANGEVEDYQIEVLTTYDYGDLPSSFENDKDGNLIPALHAPLTGFTIGSLIDLEQAPASVNSQNENNTAGDNAVELADEDGITSWPSVSRGVAYTLTVPVNIPNSLAGTKYLYAWLDLNGDGRFQSEEVTSAATNAIAPANLTLTWTAAQTATLVRGTTKVYLRVRLSNLILTDFTTAASGGSLLDERSVGNGATTTANAANNPNIAFGEVEDYQMPVDLYHFGDVPVSYEINSTDASTPARQIVNSLYSIGNIIDEEQDAQSVAPGDDNNGTNGDGIDEDGLTEVFPVITKGAPFSFSVPVTVQTASYVIAWIDFNNNGKFEANETGYTLPTGVTNGYQNAAVGTSTKTFWFRGTQTNNIPNEINNLYVRIRLSQTTGTDNASTAVIDERSIGDGANTGIYTVPTNGEIEDYQFPVKTDMDFGDTPESYDMDKDGLINPDNFKPARNHVTDALFLGLFYTLEKEPFSVAPGADNNDPNGDGASDDGLSQDQLRIRTNAVNTYLVGVNNSTGAAATLYAWIDFNNNGRFEAGESASTTVANNSISATVSFSAAQVNNIAAATGKVYMRLRLVQSNTEVSIADLSSGTNAAVVDERAIADGLSTGSYTSASLGEVEDYQLTIIRDYGDVPSSYENGIPASQTNSPGIPELIIGSTIDYELSNNAVVSGADNNGNNGDGADEDGINTPQTITSGTPFSITIPINTTLTGTKSLYAWIDFNGDGIFNGNEAATVSANITAGTTRNLTLTWNATNVSDSLMTAGKTYVRLRLSGAAITNSNSANPALIDTRSFGQGLNAGEIEDYQFQVSNLYDYGDVPVGLYEYTRDTVPVLQAARQAPSAVLRLGAIIDTEPAPNSVSADADNNGTNGDGTDEDGISSPGDIYKGKNYYSRVSVLNNTGAAKTLYSWIDFNNNGRFESSEIATVSVPTSTVQQVVTLFWTSTNTNNIPVGTDHLYMRLRISESPSLADFTTGAPGLLLDERSIGDGLNTGMYGIAYGGEIEDYQLHVVTTYDYGDVSDTYDTSRNGIIAPARQAASHGLYLGNAFADHEAVKQIETGTALGDDNNEVDDEDGTITGAIVSGGGYSVNVTATNNTGTAKTLYGWIDFNDNGRFEASEATTVAVSSGINQGTVTLNWAPSASVITGNPGQLLMRLRLSEGALNDFTTGASGLLVDERALADGASTGEYEAIPVIHNGEIEDHTIQVTTDLDYGDVPEEYEKPSTSFIPARQMSSIALHIGGTPDIEPSVQSVASGADNNGSNGDGLDEDGIDPTATEILRGAAFSLPVKVTNTIGVAKTLYGWIDINNNGLFERKEAASVSVPANTVNGTATLNWTASNTRAISASNVYVRLRLSDGALTDNTRTATYDERAVGDGLSSGIYGANALRGEIEDYRLKVTNLLTCTGTSNIPPNGVITINGIEITTSSKGSVTTYNPAYGSCVGNRLSPGSLYVGSAGEWLVTFKLNKPVNDLVILLSGTGSGGNENFIFNSNGGTVSLYSDTNCNSVINGNVILSGAGAQSSTGGGGVFRISATNAFTTLTITGSGGHAGSLLGMCSASITVQPPIISSISPDEQTVCENVIPGTITALATGAGNLSYTWYTNTNNNNTGGTLISGAHSASYTPPASSSAGTNYYYVVVTDDNTSTTSPPVSVIINECATFCYKPGLKSGNPLESKTGITSLGRAGAADPDNWPMVRRGAWMVMESKTKGFVVNRTAFDSSGNPVGIPTVDFVEGMMVYDTTNNCLKVYTSTDNGTTFSWQCMDTQSCPD